MYSKAVDKIVSASGGMHLWPPRANADMRAQAIWQALCHRHTESVQRKLADSAVAIAGLGGLGSNTAVALARIGVGRLRLVDFDVVDMTNLNRQYYFLESVGKPKTEALVEVLRELNPYITLETITGRVTPDNVKPWLGDIPIVCEAFDQAEQKAMLVSAVRSQCPESIVISGNGMAGCGANEAMHTRKVGEKLYICGDEVSAAKPGMGLMAPRVALCAAQMANAVTAIILGQAVL